jgi:hypothetical protein
MSFEFAPTAQSADKLRALCVFGVEHWDLGFGASSGAWILGLVFAV